jgi:plastocyanin
MRVLCGDRRDGSSRPAGSAPRPVRGRRGGRARRWCRWFFALLVIPSAGRAATVSLKVRLVDSTRSRRQPVDNAGAVVWLEPLDPAPAVEQAFQQQPRRYRLIQRHKRFEPHVLVVPVGSRVDFPNLDPFFHNVFSLFEGKRFDLGLYEAGSTHSVKFDRLGVSYIFCNIHPEMSAVVIAVRTPYYGISNRAGDIRWADVAPGRYRLHVWEERCLPQTLRSQSRDVTISEATSSLGTLSLAESGDWLKAHKNLYGRDYEAPTPPSPLYDQP